MIAYHDAHNHLQDDRLAPRREEILSDLLRRGVKFCVVNGTSERDWPEVATLARRHEWIIPAFGLHPWFVAGRSSAWFETLQEFLDENPKACVGEIGLDRWMENPNVPEQEEIFHRQLELAVERDLAVAIHCLKAWGALERKLKEHRVPKRGFLIHSYGGPAEMIPAFAKLGAYFSISGYFAHSRKAAQRNVFKSVPIDRLLIETDAPDMQPPPELQPAHEADIAAVYRFTADLLGMPLEALAARLAQNFERLFL